MATLDNLYIIAEAKDIGIIETPLLKNNAISLRSMNWDCDIVLKKKSNTTAEKKTILAHELGHCIRGALYNEKTPILSRVMCEQWADEWAIEHLIEYDELLRESRGAYNRTWELAEYFGVRESLIKKAIQYYEIPGWNW